MSKCFSILLALMAAVGLLALCVLCLGLNGPLMAHLFEAHSQAAGDYEALAREITAYLDGQAAELPSFQAHEAAHMADVRGLFLLCKGLAGLGLLCAGALGLRQGWKACALTQLGVLALLGLLALWAALDFDSLFIAFHRLAFRNDLWLLNPQRDLLLQLMPTAFFVDYAARIGGAYAGCALGLVVLTLCLDRRKRHELS